MRPIQFLKAYRHARIGLPPADDSLISVAAQIAAENRRITDTIGDSYRFALDLAGGPKERETRRKKAKTYSREFDNLQNDGVFRSRQSAARLPDLWAD